MPDPDHDTDVAKTAKALKSATGFAGAVHAAVAVYRLGYGLGFETHSGILGPMATVHVSAATLPILSRPGRSRAPRDVGHRASAATKRADKMGASRRVSAEIALWCVEALDRIADTLFALLLPYRDFRMKRGSKDGDRFWPCTAVAGGLCGLYKPATMDIRNIAIIAHVDHGKTTLVNGLRRSGSVRENQHMEERA